MCKYWAVDSFWQNFVTALIVGMQDHCCWRVQRAVSAAKGADTACWTFLPQHWVCTVCISNMIITYFARAQNVSLCFINMH